MLRNNWYCSIVATEIVKKCLEWSQAALVWIVREELETLRTVVEFLFGKLLLDYLAGRVGKRDLLGSLYIVVRFTFLGACLGAISGFKLILGIVWVVLFVTRIAFRE